MDKRSIQKVVGRAVRRLRGEPDQAGAGAGIAFLGGLGLGMGLALTLGPAHEPHARHDHGKRRDGSHSPDDESVRQSRLTPGLRLLLGGAGCALLGLCTARRDAAARAAGLVGAGLLASAFLNRPPWHVVGVGAGRRAVDLHTTVDIEAPIGEVFAFYQNFQNFPRFMQHVREITVIDERRSHWKVAGPAGMTIEWDAEQTVCLANERIGWKTPPNQIVEHAGTVHFEAVGDRRTRLDVRMSYNPPAGALGHVVAFLFQVDPKTALNDDLTRLKGLLEGSNPAPGQNQGQGPNQGSRAGQAQSGAPAQPPPLPSDLEPELEPEIVQVMDAPPALRGEPWFESPPPLPIDNRQSMRPEPPMPQFEPAQQQQYSQPPQFEQQQYSQPPQFEQQQQPFEQQQQPFEQQQFGQPSPDFNSGWVAEPVAPQRGLDNGLDQRPSSESEPGMPTAPDLDPQFGGRPR